MEFGTQQVVAFAGQLMENGVCPRSIDALLQNLGEENSALNPVARAIRVVLSEQYQPHICERCDKRYGCDRRYDSLTQSQQQPSSP